MSSFSNEGFMMRCKAVTDILFTVVGSPQKPNQTAISVPETTLRKYISIS